MRPFWKLVVRRADGAVVTLTGKQARALSALIHAWPRGITPADASRFGWAFRLSAYIRELRLQGFNIETVREELADGGPIIGRYILRERLEIVTEEKE